MTTYLILRLRLVLLDHFGEGDVILIVLETFGWSLLKWKLTTHLLTLILHHAIKRVEWGESWRSVRRSSRLLKGRNF